MGNKKGDNEHDGDINKVRTCKAENSALYYCMNCGLMIKNESESRNHIDRMHASWMKYKMGNDERYWCIECNMSYKCEDEFSKHYNQKHRFKCDLCKNKFTQNIKLENHIRDQLDPRTG